MSKLRSAIFYLKRPAYWAHLRQRALKPFLPDLDTRTHRMLATQWARARALPLAGALAEMGLARGQAVPAMSKDLVHAALENARRSGCRMGGAGHVELIYAAARLSGARTAVETGVAYGWSSMALLAAMQDRDGRLISVDRPYPGRGNEPYVGIAVPSVLRRNWAIVHEPDRNGLRKAVAAFPEGIDIVHYDSDKSFRGRMFGYSILWRALKFGGIFISDDIQDNLAFANFVNARHISFAVTEAAGKYVGIAVKPGLREAA